MAIHKRVTAKSGARQGRRSKDAVVAAALAASAQLLMESGLAGVSIDEVSRRSGVAKTTIYRHWPNRAALLLDACAKLSPRPQAPDTGNLRADLAGLALGMARRLQTGRWSSVVPSIIDAAEHDPELARIHSQLHADMMSAFSAVLDRARGRGELALGAGPEIAASIAGPLFYRRWFSREPITEAFIQGLVDRVLGPPAPTDLRKLRVDPPRSAGHIARESSGRGKT